MAEKMQLVVDVKLGDVDISNVEKKLAGLNASINASGGAASYSAAAKPAASSVGGSDKATTSLGTIAAGVAIGNVAAAGILKELDVIINASAGLQDMLSMVSKLISMMVQPFVNLLIPLLLPLVMLLTPLVRMLNMALKPLFDMMMGSMAKDNARISLMTSQGKWLEAIAYFVATLAIDLAYYLVLAATGLGKIIMDMAGWLAKGIVDLGAWILNGIVDVSAVLAMTIIQGISNIMQFVVTTLLGAIKFLEVTIGGVIKWLADGMFDGLKTLITTTVGFANALISGINTLIDATITFANGMLGLAGIKIEKPTPLNEIKIDTKFIDDAKKSFDMTIDSTGNNIQALADGINTGIQNSLMEVQGGIAQWAENTKSIIKSWVADKSLQMQGWVDYTKSVLDDMAANAKLNMQGFKDTVYDTLVPSTNKAGAAMVNLATTLISVTNKATEAAQNAAKGKLTETGTATQTVTSAAQPVTTQTTQNATNTQTGATSEATAAQQAAKIAAQVDDSERKRVTGIWAAYQNQLLASGLAYGNPKYYFQKYINSGGTELAYTPNYLNLNDAAQTIESGAYAKYIGDAVITPQGQVIHQSPDDYIMATTNPSSLANMNGGTGGNTYNITINGNGERVLADLMKQAIENHDATLSRSGYYQQGR